MTKAKYYVEWLHADGWTNDHFPNVMGYTSIRSAFAAVEAWMSADFNKFPWRIRHKGRTIDRWQDGRRVTK